MNRTALPAELGPGAAVGGPRLTCASRVEVGDDVVEQLSSTGAAVAVDDAARVEAGRDWWPLSTLWALEGRVPSLPAVVVRPTEAGQLAEVLAICHEEEVPVTVFAGRSGVCGASLPLFGGVSLDLTGLSGLASVDSDSLLIDVRAGTFGDPLEAELRSGHDLTLGHWPQSVSLSTVGGWLACRGAGQYSTRYGKIEDMVAGLEVVMADGRIVRTGGCAPRQATGPDLTQLFVGSEGTLGVITEARLRVHPVPPHERRAVYTYAQFEDGLEACRRILRRGATPAVLRLYDRPESARQFEAEDVNVLIVVDEGDPVVVDAAMRVVAEECRDAGSGDEALAARWLENRNHLPSVESLVRAGIVVDTVEVAASWRALPGLYAEAVARLQAVPGTMAASAHQSHAYTDGACLYFTFAGRPDVDGEDAERAAEGREQYYRRAFDAVTGATLAAGGAISHHHGVGLNRARYMPAFMGPSLEVLQSVKDALDPRGILNPGKLGLDSQFGEVPEHP